MKRTPPLLLSIACAAVTAVGCEPRPATYRPSLPHRGTAPGIEAEMVEVGQGAGITVTVDVKSGSGARLQRGLLAPAAASPCREGARDTGLRVDGQEHWLRPVAIEGSHRVTFTFPPGASSTLLYQTPVVDLVVLDEVPDRPEGPAAQERCVRIALSGGAPELRWERPVVWDRSTSLRFIYPSHAMGSVDNGWSVDLGFGRWFGPLRAKLELGAGGADCYGSCPPGPKGSGRGFWWFPLRASIDAYVLETTGFGIAAEAAVEQLSAVRTNPDDTSRWETSRGPRGALRFDVLPLPPPGWPREARQYSFGLEFSVARWFAATSSDAPALVWGFGIVSRSGF